MHSYISSSEAAAIQVNPENYGGFYQNSNIQSPFSNFMFSAVSPMTPQANAVPFVGPDDGSLQSERIDSSLADIDPMRVNSENVRETLMADPNALRESLGSIELNATRNASSEYDQRENFSLCHLHWPGNMSCKKCMLFVVVGWQFDLKKVHLCQSRSSKEIAILHLFTQN